MKKDCQLTLTAFALLHIAIACKASEPEAVGPSPLSAPAPESVQPLQYCELDVLDTLRWQQAYDPAGYSVVAPLPLNCTVETWQAMGCLKSLVNLTLTGQLPDLPDSWGANGSFPMLQSMNFSAALLPVHYPASGL